MDNKSILVLKLFIFESIGYKLPFFIKLTVQGGKYGFQNLEVSGVSPYRKTPLRHEIHKEFFSGTEFWL